MEVMLVKLVSICCIFSKQPNHHPLFQYCWRGINRDNLINKGQPSSSTYLVRAIKNGIY